MFELLIMFSRYLFVLYIGIFLWQGAIYVAYEQGYDLGDPDYAVSIQRLMIVFLHITAFLILAYNPGEFSFNIQTIALGIGGLIFILIFRAAAERVYKNSCPLIWNSMFFLMDTGFIMLQRLRPDLAFRQLLWMTTGVLIALFIPIMLRIVPKFEKFELLYIILAYILIMSTLLFGNEEYGSVNWLKIGGIGFQPSEVVKFLFIFYIASVFRKKVELRELIVTAGLSGGIVLLMVFQRDLGSALIFFMTYMAMLYIATSNELLFLSGMGCASAAAVLAYHLFSHVRVRVAAWSNPWADALDGGHQIVQSLFAITTWGVWGSGLTKGMPKSIPVVERDFIFSAICEELGVFFGIGLICIFVILFFRGIIISIRCDRRFYSLLAAGVITMLSFQSFIIIGGVIKLIPMTGVTLPFVNYGGSSIVISILLIGILQWINSYCVVYEEEYYEYGGGDDDE